MKKKKKEGNDEFSGFSIDNFMSFIKRDMVYIILLLFALGVCYYDLFLQTNYQDMCNDHWLKQIKNIEKFGVMSDVSIKDYEFFNESLFSAAETKNVFYIS